MGKGSNIFKWKHFEATMHIIKKGQVKLKNLSAPNNVQLFQKLFGLIA
jgi:hypothetical protein